ncbi:MAG TPA: hydantoinase/oxoprolinase N-terminal domain-containing protein [Pseudonocardiaceae bacterium]|nr:hydantoinase/oxoprolinase N-terminal domain-containing protein [Pseudonocardiaceae bacterium]
MSSTLPRHASRKWSAPTRRSSLKECPCTTTSAYYYVGVDIGGTFTDCVLVDRQGNHRTAKVLSTKDDPVAGVLAGLSRLAETAGVDLPPLLERTERLDPDVPWRAAGGR